MKTRLFRVLIALALLLVPYLNYGQAPTLGTTSTFALFTASGAFTSTGASNVTGDVGTHVGAFSAFPPGTLVGTQHVLDPLSTTAAADVATAYAALASVTCGIVHGTTLGNGEVLSPNVYCLGGISSQTGDLVLDGGGDPNALFIIKITGAFSMAAGSSVTLKNSASICNVYWQIGGQFDLGAGAAFVGTALVDGAIIFASGSSLMGRGLSTAGAISLSDNTVTLSSGAAAAGIVTGSASVCAGQTGVTYSVPAISGAAGYVWTLPTGATITSGANTNNITVSYSAGATNGNVSVQGTGGCGNGTASANFAVTVGSLPAAAGTITGTATICTAQTGVVYSVPAITGATGYVWALPAGATITSGSNTNSITVSYSAIAVSGNATVYGTNACGNGTISANYALTIGSLPNAAGTITGTATVCQGATSVVYSVPAITGATGYTWTLPTGATITSGTNTNSITVSYSASATSGNVTVKGTSTCGSGTVSANYAVTVNALPLAAGTVTGTATVCQGATSVVYSVASITGATGYAWTLPTGASITAGNNTNSITVSYSASAVSGNIAVHGTNACGSGTASANYAVVVNSLPGAAGTITGTSPVCKSTTGVVYSVPVITGATGYVWTLPTGATITSGSNTKSITVSYSASAVSGNISVHATNACGNGTVSANYALTINTLPLAAGTITGAATVCQGASSVVYSVPAITGATGYTWTLPAGATITSGANTNSITVSYSIIATSGNVTVLGSSSCGNGTISANYAVTVNPLPKAAGTITGTATVCQSTTGNVYSVPAITGATGYAWTLPTGATITSGSNTNSITVSFSASAVSGNISVHGTNACGNGTASANYAVTVNSIPAAAGTITGTSTVCQGATGVVYTVPAINGATGYTWNLPVGATITAGSNTNSITVSYSASAVSGDVNVLGKSSCGNGTVSANHAITVNSLPLAAGIITGSATVCQGSSSVVYSVATITGAAGYTWTLPVGATITSGNNTNTITVSYSGSAVSGNVTVLGSNTCGNGTVSANHAVTVNSVPVASVISAGTATTFCKGDSVRLSGNIGGTWNTGATTASILVKASGNYFVTDSNNCGKATSNHIIVTVNPSAVASIITAGGPTTFCKGGYVLLNGNKGGTWNTGAITSSIIVAASGDYYVTNTNNCGSVKSNHISVVVNIPPVASIITAGGSTSFCAGGNVILSGNVGGKWNNGAITSSIDVTTSGDYYVTNTTPCGTVVSNHIKVGVATKATSPVSKAVCEGSSAVFSVSATGTAVTYQWRRGNMILVNGGNISGANTSTLTISHVSAYDAALNYNVVITGACPANDTSVNVGLAVNTAPKILGQPYNQSACAGGCPESFLVVATGNGLTYQWRRGNVNLSDGENISGAQTPMLTFNPVNNSDTASDYNVVVSGTCNPSVTSVDVSLQVCVPTGISSVKSGSSSNAVSVYPNPFRSAVNVQINSDWQITSCEFRLYNALGAEVMNTTLTDQLTTVEMSSFAPGIYFYKIIDHNKIIQTGKLVSQK